MIVIFTKIVNLKFKIKNLKSNEHIIINYKKRVYCQSPQ
jgi:hypothetical protein